MLLLWGREEVMSGSMDGAASSPLDAVRMLRTQFSGSVAEISKILDHMEISAALLEGGDVPRTERSEKAPVEVLDFDVDERDEGVTLVGKVQGVSSVYDVRIRTFASDDRETWFRTYRCSCPDSQLRGRAVGPCKHTLALAKEWINSSFSLLNAHFDDLASLTDGEEWNFVPIRASLWDLEPIDDEQLSLPFRTSLVRAS